MYLANLRKYWLAKNNLILKLENLERFKTKNKKLA
jgi:hypothetical protein